MNKGKNEERKEEYWIRYFTELSRTVRNLILHLLFTAARAFVIKAGMRNSKRKLRSALFKIKGWSLKLLETLRSTHYNEVAFEDAV